MPVAADPCFECGAPSVEDHHVIPVSRGGHRTVPLCGSCHGRVHGMRRVDDVGLLTRMALVALKEKGVRLGAPRRLPPAVEARIAADRAGGLSLRTIASALNAEGVRTASDYGAGPRRAPARWHASTVAGVLRSLALDAEAAAAREAGLVTAGNALPPRLSLSPPVG